MLYPNEITDKNDYYHPQAPSSIVHNVSDFNLSLIYNNSYPYMLLCEFEPEDLIAQKIFNTCVCLLYGTIFTVALLGNGLVCFVVHTTPRMKTVTNYFIVNLAVGDILLTVFCVPFSSISTLVLKYWPFGAVMCKVVNYSQAVSVLVSAYTLLAISIDRYIVIMRPMKPRVEKAAAKLVVAAVWLGALVTAAPIPLVSTLQQPSDWHFVCDVDVCGEQWTSTEHSDRYTYALLALQFALPLSALVCTYARIAHVVWDGRPPGEAHCARDSRIARSKRKMIKMMVIVVIVFTICWLPLNTLMVLWSAHEQEWGRWPGMPYVWFASHWLAMSHSCYNPIIYCYMNARYRRGFKQVSITTIIIYCYINARYQRGFKQVSITTIIIYCYMNGRYRHGFKQVSITTIIIYCYMNSRYRHGFKQVSITTIIIYCYINASYRRGFKQVSITTIIIYCYMSVRYRNGFKQVSIKTIIIYCYMNARYWRGFNQVSITTIIIYFYMNARYRHGFKQASITTIIIYCYMNANEKK